MAVVNGKSPLDQPGHDLPCCGVDSGSDNLARELTVPMWEPGRGHGGRAASRTVCPWNPPLIAADSSVVGVVATEEMAGTSQLVRLSTPDWKLEHTVSDHLGRPIVGVTYVSTDLAHFTHWRNMFNGVVAAGATPVSVDCAALVPDLDEHIARMDGLILSGGGDVDPRLYGGELDDALLTNVNPLRDQQERVALESALNSRMPILAICRGLQFVNVAFGGALYADLARDKADGTIHQGSEEALDRPMHEVEVSPGSLIAKWMGVDGPIQVNSKHHQGIAHLAPSLNSVAHSPDGLVEAVEARQDNARERHPTGRA